MPFLLVVLVLNIISNLALRSHEQNVGRALQASPVTGVLFSFGLFAAMFFIVFGIVRLLASGSRDATVMIFSALWAGIRYFLSLLGRFFEWLFSLLPYNEYEMDFEIISEAPAEMGEAAEQLQMKPEILYIITAVVALAAIAGLIYVLFRFRKKRLHEKIAAPSATRQPVRRSKGAGRLRKRFLALIAAIVFTVKSFRYINTPPGTLVRLERWGKRRGMARRPGQTTRGFLLSLSQDLRPVADDLDLIYFGRRAGRLSKADCRRMRRDFFRTRKGKAHYGTNKSNSRPSQFQRLAYIGESC